MELDPRTHVRTLQARFSRRRLLAIVAGLLVGLVWFAALGLGAARELPTPTRATAPAPPAPPAPVAEPADDGPPAELLLGTQGNAETSGYAPGATPPSLLPPPSPSVSNSGDQPSGNARGAFGSRPVTCTRATKLVASRRAMLRLLNAKPGQSASACIVIAYAGSAPATVSLYGKTTGTGLDRYVDLTVIRGTVRQGSFRADSRNYIGAGAGVVYRGTVRDFPDSAARGLVDPTRRARERWTKGEAHAYRFVVTLQDVNAAQGLTTTQAFTWRARAL